MNSDPFHGCNAKSQLGLSGPVLDQPVAEKHEDKPGQRGQTCMWCFRNSLGKSHDQR